MWLIVGLGNPGPKYGGNRHNVGFMAVDALHDRFTFPAWKNKFNAEISEGKFEGLDEKILLVQPQTFMNVSGEAVQAAASFYKVPASQIVVFHDDLDLAALKVKVKQGGGAGGHNGLASLDQHIGKEYWRVRLGIGHPGIHEPNKAELVSNYVLSDFSKDEKRAVEPMLDKLAKAFPAFISEAPEKFLTYFHSANQG
jgi:PTH1 family peptidyl-tRNA hydrolase